MEKKITWYDNSACRPAKDGSYVVFTDSGYLDMLDYRRKWNLWNVTDDNADYAIDVKYWAIVELPGV